jgi:WhiB family redox-sensing transcriptional regulator
MTLLAVEHPDWMLDAECTRAKPELFYPEPAGRSVNEAKAICARCTVTAECLAFALTHGELHFGVWGGLSAKERQQLVPSRGRGRRRIPLAIEHGTEGGAQAHRRRGEQPCAWCREASAAIHQRRAEHRRTA